MFLNWSVVLKHIWTSLTMCTHLRAEWFYGNKGQEMILHRFPRDFKKNMLDKTMLNDDKKK